jgi:L-aminopeptidase/D-esterase-like protein
VITDVPGIEVGHATNEQALTGCTVVLCRDGATAGVAVRGAAPGTRETDLCRPGTLIERVHAVLLTGGSAFGLEAAAGVMRHLAAAGIGYDARGITVPIVPAAVIFDLAVGQRAWPDAEMGARAAADASATVVSGRVGAGTGATIGKLLGPANAMRGGLGTASVRSEDAVLGALAVVNAGGDVLDPATGRIVAGTRDPETGEWADSAALARQGLRRPPLPVENTTLAVVACSVPLTVEQANYIAGIAHDGFARTIRPVHTMHDGDTIFALAPGDGPKVDSLRLTQLGVLAVEAVERAVLDAVHSG